MDHEKRSLRTKAQQMWHATFANSLKTAEIPKEVAEILRKSLLLSSESSQGRLFDLKHRSESLCTLKDESDVHKMSGFLYPLCPQIHANFPYFHHICRIPPSY